METTRSTSLQSFSSNTNTNRTLTIHHKKMNIDNYGIGILPHLILLILNKYI